MKIQRFTKRQVKKIFYKEFEEWDHNLFNDYEMAFFYYYKKYDSIMFLIYTTRHQGRAIKITSDKNQDIINKMWTVASDTQYATYQKNEIMKELNLDNKPKTTAKKRM